MSALSSLDRYETLIRRLVEEFGYSCHEVQNVLQTQHGIETGASLSSVYQFCASRNIHRFDYARLGRSGVDAVVGSAVTACGPGVWQKGNDWYVKSFRIQARRKEHQT